MIKKSEFDEEIRIQSLMLLAQNLCPSELKGSNVLR